MGEIITLWLYSVKNFLVNWMVRAVKLFVSLVEGRSLDLSEDARVRLRATLQNITVSGAKCLRTDFRDGRLFAAAGLGRCSSGSGRSFAIRFDVDFKRAVECQHGAGQCPKLKVGKLTTF